jgi:hypothetical protein
MTQREAEVIAEAVAPPVPLVVDRPLALLPGARLDVLIGDNTRAADRRLNAEAMNEPCPAGKPCLGGHGLLLKGSDTIVVIRMGSVGSHHGRKSIFGSKIDLNLLF